MLGKALILGIGHVSVLGNFYVKLLIVWANFKLQTKYILPRAFRFMNMLDFKKIEFSDFKNQKMSTTSEDAEEETITEEENESSSRVINSNFTVPGQPSIPEGQINIKETPYFSYKYFERQPNEQARCLL